LQDLPPHQTPPRVSFLRQVLLLDESPRVNPPSFPRQAPSTRPPPVLQGPPPHPAASGSAPTGTRPMQVTKLPFACSPFLPRRRPPRAPRWSCCLGRGAVLRYPVVSKDTPPVSSHRPTLRSGILPLRNHRARRSLQTPCGLHHRTWCARAVDTPSGSHVPLLMVTHHCVSLMCGKPELHHPMPPFRE